ncbi:unnamed protein product [Discula destructiva]
MDVTESHSRRKVVTNLNSSFHCRRKTIMRRAEQLRAEFDTRCYIVMYRAGRYYTYMSHPPTLHWPPPASEIPNYFPVPHMVTPANFVSTNTENQTTDEGEQSTVGSQEGDNPNTHNTSHTQAQSNVTA